MLRNVGRFLFPIVLLLLVLSERAAQARTPEIAIDTREGVWMAAGDTFVHQARDRWSVFFAGAAVNGLAVDELTVWIATDEGLIRFESGSRRLSRFTMDQGLPSDVVQSVAVDDQYVWFATNKGLVRYRKIDRALKVYEGEEDGLPHRAVNDIVVAGRRVWFATRAGLAVYDPQVDGIRAYGIDDGMSSDFVEELYVVKDDVWCRTDAGLSRFQVESRRFTNFSFEEIGGQQIGTFVPDGDRIWVGTENGLSIFETTGDNFVPFPQQGSLESKTIIGVEPFTDYLFITTDQGLVQYHKVNRTFRFFTEADGISREAGARGTVLVGGQLTLLFSDGAVVYDIQRDLFTDRSLEATEKAGDDGKGASFEVWSKVDTEVPVDLLTKSATEERYATVAVGGGTGDQFEDGRSLDLSVVVDYGDVELDGVRDVQVKGQYLGTKDHIVREIELGDRVEHRTVEEGIERPLTVVGGHSRLASRGDDPVVSGTVDAGMLRGPTQRDFLTGPRQEIYGLSQRYILPGSERVYLDGELLTSGLDYTIIYPAGQLAFLDPDRVDDLSIIEVEYEYDLLPKKGLGVISLFDLLPADNEVGSWVQSGEPTVVTEESGLYAQIDGAAPKYIDRGWKRSVFAEYASGSRNIRLVINDMSTEQQAEDIYNYDLPPAREPIGDRENMVLDIGLATSYAVKAFDGVFYIELSIDEKSESAKQLIKLFAIQILDRGSTAGELDVDAAREAIWASRVAVSPARGFEVGGRAVQVMRVGEGTPLAGRAGNRLTGIVDARYASELEGGGQVTAYGEAASSHELDDDRDQGFAGMGRLRISNPWLDGSVSGRYSGPGYSPLGSNATMFGTLQDETRLDATAYPVRWLPTTVFLSRQASRLAERDGSAVVRHALVRMQLARGDAPSTTLQLGQSLLDDGIDGTTSRVKVLGQTEYDLAQGILKGLGMRRFSLSGLYSLSDASTETTGQPAVGAQTEVYRVEAKIAPTTTEAGYALFRSRKAWTRDDRESDRELLARHWELNAGVRSAFVPGLIPQLNHSVLFDDSRLDGSVRRSTASLSAQLGIYPGDWFAALTPVSIDARYSIAEDGQTEDELRTLFRRLHRVDNRMSYNSMGAIAVELYELYEVSVAGENREREGDRLELRNRIIYRPTFNSPISLRLDYFRDEARNAPAPGAVAPPWGAQTSYETALEWLMRWDAVFTTRVRTTYTLTEVDNLVVVDPGTMSGSLQDYLQHAIRPEVELRLLLQRDHGSFFLIQRNQLIRSFGSGDGVIDALGADFAVGAIWAESGILYLDAEVAYRYTHCYAEPCAPASAVVPRMLLTVRL